MTYRVYVYISFDLILLLDLCWYKVTTCFFHSAEVQQEMPGIVIELLPCWQRKWFWWWWWLGDDVEDNKRNMVNKKSTVPRCATMIWWCQCWCWLLLVMRTTRDQHEWNKHSGQTDWDCDKDGNIKTEQQLYTTCTTINSNSFTLILILTMMVMVMIILITMKTTIMIVDDSCLAYILICICFQLLTLSFTKKYGYVASQSSHLY